MKARFEFDQSGDCASTQALSSKYPQQHLEPQYIDPEAPVADSSDLESYDESEQYFAITLNKETRAARFVLNDDASKSDTFRDCENPRAPSNENEKRLIKSSSVVTSEQSEQRDLVGFGAVKLIPQAEECWRQEVSARLSKYQARRRIREPRYPSLQLRFDPPVSRHDSSPQPDPVIGPISDTSTLAMSTGMEAIGRETPAEATRTQAIEPVARIIEFPRSSFFNIPSDQIDELAEPVFERPRIMEAVDLVPPPLALGGILIERAEIPANEKRPGFEMPLQAAKMGKRLFATAIDILAVLSALALFGSIFWKVNETIPPPRIIIPTVALLAAILWAGYQYISLVYCGTTPGLKLARLTLSHFDDSPVPRRMRRWRFIASVLSGLPLGLGYAWCFLDEDQLCWHDRITRTYIAPMT